MSRVLCTVSDLDDTGAKEIVLDKDGGRYPVFVVRAAGRIIGYENSCPHARLPLNWRPDAFFDISRTYLFCANHGAHFDPVSGHCLRGPCKGQTLTPYPVRVEGDVIISDAA